MCYGGGLDPDPAAPTAEFRLNTYMRMLRRLRPYLPQVLLSVVVRVITRSGLLLIASSAFCSRLWMT